MRSANGANGPYLIARDGLAARQWDAYYFDADGRDRSAGIAPPLSSYRAWLAARWQATLGSDDPRALLTPPQSAALWRAVIESSPVAERLLEARHAARWAAHARRLLTDWRLGDGDVENADVTPDAQAFLAWQRSYVERLRESDWLDEPSLPNAIAGYAAPTGLVLLDLGAPTKAQSALFATLQGRGCNLETREPPNVECSARQIGLQDTREELEHAAAWAVARLREQPHARLALVVPDLAKDPALALERVRRAFGAEPPALGSAAGLPLGAMPAIGGALGALELATPRATFATLSRWLRSPFFHGTDGPAQSAAAATEATLRNDIGAQLPFMTAYERAGLSGRLTALVPELAARLHAGLEELKRPRPAATPDGWARAWSRALAQLGWATAGTGVDAVAIRAWEEALTGFARLTPILGTCTQETALEQLRAVAEAPLPVGLPLHGLHILARADDVGPGYAGVWIAGATDRNWPEPARLNPLLPALLQIRHGMPWSTPADSLARARATLARLRRRTPELVLSWPRVVHDYQALPSPLLAEIAVAAPADLGPTLKKRSAPPRARALLSSPDPAPALTTTSIPGGAHTLDLQARCPIRAFCETRLGARALPQTVQGLTPRTQGIGAHRALELLARGGFTEETQSASPSAPSDAIAACVQRALIEVFGPARAALRALFELESNRLRQLLERFIEAERRRPPFRTVAIEQRTEIRVGAFTIACRLDRLDELGNDTLALIDYKTGSGRTKAQWLDERSASTQLPLYALEVGPRLAALLTVELGTQAIAYRGVARQPNLIAPSLRAVPGDSWTALIDGWRVQIRALAEDYAGGDVRIYAEDWSEAAGEHAALTRVYAYAMRQGGDDS